MSDTFGRHGEIYWARSPSTRANDGHQRMRKRPKSWSRGTAPHTRLSDLLPRLSPMTK